MNELQVIGADVIAQDSFAEVTEGGVVMRDRGIAPTGSGLASDPETRRAAHEVASEREAPAGICISCRSRRVSGVRSAELCPSCLDAKEAEQARLVKVKGAAQRWPKHVAEVESRKQNLADSYGLEWRAGHYPGLLVAHPITACSLCSAPAVTLNTVLSVGASEFVAAQEGRELALREDTLGLCSEHTGSNLRLLEEVTERGEFFLAQPASRSRPAYWVVSFSV